MNKPTLRAAGATPPQHVRLSDVQGLARLAVDGVQQVTHVAEGLHAQILRGMGLGGGTPDDGRAGGLTGAIYGAIRGTTGLIGRGVDSALTALQPRLALVNGESSAARDAVVSALNGVLGDKLADSRNPLATPMSLCQDGRPISPAAVPDARRKVLLLVHGLCMNDRQWQHGGPGGGHGQVLAESLGYTAVYLRYNTGRSITANGRELARRLEQWLAEWPVPVDELVVVAHSMGGLVTRSACHFAAKDQRAWLGKLRSIVFLGTPHHGAPLEQAGYFVERLLGRTAYSAPFGRLARLRSAGITDLRHGRVLEQDGPVPLPAGVRCYTVAATTARSRGPLADHVVGDGLVPLASALGDCDDPAFALGIPEERRWIAHGMGHLALLARPEVTDRLRLWLATNAAPAPTPGKI